MRTKTLALLAILATSTMLLAWCNNNTNNESEVVEPEEVLNEAWQYCVDNWWSHQIVTSETAVYGECTLPDGTVCEEWEYFNGECPANVENEYALTIEDLDLIDEKAFPTSYTYTTYNFSTEERTGPEEYIYPEDISHTLLIPEHATMASREVINSGIQDGMIYVETKATLQDDTEINILYIVNPETMQYVAANVENWDVTTNYQFAY